MRQRFATAAGTVRWAQERVLALPRWRLAFRAVRSVPRHRLEPTNAWSKQCGIRHRLPAPQHRGDPAPLAQRLLPHAGCAACAARRLRARSPLSPAEVSASAGAPDPAASPAVRTAPVPAGSLHRTAQGPGCSRRRRRPSPAGKAGTRAGEAGRGEGKRGACLDPRGGAARSLAG